MCHLECLTGVGEQRDDLTIPSIFGIFRGLGLHCEVVIGALDEIGDSSARSRLRRACEDGTAGEGFRGVAGGGAARYGLHTDTFGGGEAHSPLTPGESPAEVTPLAVSAGGGILPEDDDRLSCGAARNGRHVTRRVERDPTEVSGCAYVAVVEAPTKLATLFAQATSPSRHLESTLCSGLGCSQRTQCETQALVYSGGT